MQTISHDPNAEEAAADYDLEAELEDDEDTLGSLEGGKVYTIIVVSLKLNSSHLIPLAFI